VTSPAFLRLYPGFAVAYLLSYLYRTVNAVISPDLSAVLGISASSLGLLTSAYFLAFAAMQLPAGMLLDRYGPRRVEPVLLSIAGCGALAFAASDNLTSLVLARALIGAGVAVCLMAPLKAVAMWYPADRQASLSGWMMVAGGMGALLATAPLAAALALMSWRAIFLVLAVVTFAAAVLLFLTVPEVNVLAFTVLSEGFPRELTARANTALNLLMFGGSFAAQWGIGLLVDAARIALGVDTAGGLRLAFALVLAIDVAAYGWLLFGWRRHAVTPAAMAMAIP
jgi:MFS family permease